MGFLNNYIRSKEFKHTSRKTADSVIKLIFSWGAWAVMGFFNFIKDMFKMGIGSR